MYISLYGKLYIITKMRNGNQTLFEVPRHHNDGYKHMKVDDCIKSNTEYGISYVCNGDFNSLSIQ